jgi:hypothetical protein
MDINGKPLVVNKYYKLGNHENALKCIYLGIDSLNNNVIIFSCKHPSGRVMKMRRIINRNNEIYIPFHPEMDEVWSDNEDSDDEIVPNLHRGGRKKTRKTRKTKTRKTKTSKRKRKYTKK